MEYLDEQSKYGKIYKVAGPRKWSKLWFIVVVGEGMSGVKMYELVKIGWYKLVGEVIKIEADRASI